MDKRQEFSQALKEAMRSKNQVATSTIRLILAALKDRDIEARGKGKDSVSDQDILSLMQSMIKQRNESTTTYRDAGRDDLADRELAEIDVIKSFLPEQMSDQEVQEKVDDLINELDIKDIKDMGRIMGALKSRYAGQVDMAKAGSVVRERLVV